MMPSPLHCKIREEPIHPKKELHKEFLKYNIGGVNMGELHLYLEKKRGCLLEDGIPADPNGLAL